MDIVITTGMGTVTISIIIIGEKKKTFMKTVTFTVQSPGDQPILPGVTKTLSLTLHRHRRTPSTSSLASNTLRRGTHNNSSGGSGKNCCDYLKVTVSDHQSPKIYVEKCCAGGAGGTGVSGSSDHNLDDEVERYFYVHQGTNHSSRKSSLAHGNAGSSSQYGSHCSLSRSRCGSMRRRRSDHSITTTADVNVNNGSRTTTPLIHRNSNERLRHLQGTRTMSPMMLDFHNSYQGVENGRAAKSSSGHRARASSSGSTGSCHARDDGHYSSNELIPNR